MVAVLWMCILLKCISCNCFWCFDSRFTYIFLFVNSGRSRVSLVDQNQLKNLCIGDLSVSTGTMYVMETNRSLRRKLLYTPWSIKLKVGCIWRIVVSILRLSVCPSITQTYEPRIVSLYNLSFHSYISNVPHFLHIDGLVQERRSSIANALELRLSCTNPSTWCVQWNLPYNTPCTTPDFASATTRTLQWRHNGCDDVSNHQPHNCSRNRLFRHRWKKTSNSVSLAFVRGIHQWPVNSRHKWPVTWKMLPFDDGIMTQERYPQSML